MGSQWAIGFGRDGIGAVAEALGLSPVTTIAGTKELREQGGKHSDLMPRRQRPNPELAAFLSSGFLRQNLDACNRRGEILRLLSRQVQIDTDGLGYGVVRHELDGIEVFAE